MISTAVILAAGKGERMKGLNGDSPKGFLEIDSNKIIELSISKLINFGIRKIFIGTGYSSHYYEKLSEKYPQIICVKNSDFNETGSMHTLYNFKNLIKEDFILLESDLIYDSIALKKILESSKENVILCTESTNSGDEVFLEVDKNYNLIKLSKNKEKINNSYGELVGITKISHDAFIKLCNYYENESNKKIHYEEGFEKIPVDFFVQKENFNWCEIDTPEMLEKAKEIVYPRIKESEKKMYNKDILLTPGPANTTNSVKYAQVVKDICPREKEFVDIIEEISNELTLFVGNPENYVTVIFGGSGTAAVESVLSSVIPNSKNKKILVINNGAYGERMCKILNSYDIPYVEFKSSYVGEINLERLEKIITQEKNLEYLSLVHHETTSGLLNNTSKIGKLCSKYKIKMIVDAISSYAAIPIDMESMNISYLIASSNKNLQGMAGVGFVICNKKDLESIKSNNSRNFYLNLYDQYEYFIKNHQTRFTPPVQTIYALKQAIIETKIETIPKRYERYKKCWDILINGLKELNLSHIVKEENSSKLITSIVEPSINGYSFEDMHDFLKKRGFIIYPGKIENLNTFRISNIGDITPENMKSFIKELKNYFISLKKQKV